MRRLAENTAGALPIMALLFVPVVLGFGELYHHWNDIEQDATKPGFDAVLHGKAAWLNPGAFYVRAAIYFVIWIGLALYFRTVLPRYRASKARRDPPRGACERARGTGRDRAQAVR